MTDEQGWPATANRLPTDLRLVLGSVALLWLVTLVPVVKETPLRIAVAVPFALFVPGYALIAALFPERKVTAPAAGMDDSEDESETTGIDSLERAVLSFGASIALVPLTGLLLNFTPWGIRLLSILVALAVLTVALTVFAAVRRSKLPADERYEPAIEATIGTAISGFTGGESRADTVLNVVLLLSVCLTAGSVAYAVTVPADGESFTEFYLLTENESGDVVAGDYPANLTTGDPSSIVVGIGNREGVTTNYTVVTELQRVRVDGNRTTITEYRELDRFSRRVGADETVQVRRTLTPREFTGQRLRLQFRLYNGTALSEGNRPPPYRETHLWVNVTEA